MNDLLSPSDKNYVNRGELTPCLLFEGVSRGKGRLVITFNTGTAPYYTKIGEGGGVYMDLKDIKELYERWTVGDTAVLNPQASLLTPYYGGGSPANQATISQDRLSSGIAPLQYSASTPGLFVPLDPNGNKYILFVHGYNLQPWEKDTFAETALKRLYWQGFKGKFAAFQWPTTYHLAELGGSVDYDMAEYTAWQAATPLRGLIQKLNGNSTGVYVLAHSMGNVVTGEALRLQGPQSLLAGYVASQAAVPVQCYDASQQTPVGFFGTARHPIGNSLIPTVTPVLLTPNIYPNWLGSNQTPAGSLINFYNVNDWALSLVVWQTDEALKPDLFSGIYPPYGYRFGSFTHTPKLGIFQQGFTSGNLTLANSSGLHDQYEIMAFAAQAQCLALGATPNPAGFNFLVDVQQFWGTDPFNNSFKDHVWHSAEFNFSNAEQQAYWKNLLGLNAFNLAP